jgi:hypothetical protein
MVSSYCEIASISGTFSTRPYNIMPTRPLLGVMIAIYQNIIERMLVRAEQLLKEVLEKKEEDSLSLTMHIKDGITFLLKNLAYLYTPFSSIFSKELECENYTLNQGFDAVFGVLTNCIQTSIDYSINAVESVALSNIYNAIDVVLFI